MKVAEDNQHAAGARQVISVRKPTQTYGASIALHLQKKTKQKKRQRNIYKGLSRARSLSMIPVIIIIFAFFRFFVSYFFSLLD
jgi:hypothetical protein